LTKPDQALSRSGFVVSTFPVSSIQFTRSFIMSDNTNTFRSLFQIDVSKYVEMKGQFSYLSWPFAVAQLRLADPNAFWEVRRFDGLPYLNTELGYFVEVAVTVQGVTLSQIHPVLDHKNRPILAPHRLTSIRVSSARWSRRLPCMAWLEYLCR
jgi:hypothetical protein